MDPGDETQSPQIFAAAVDTLSGAALNPDLNPQPTQNDGKQESRPAVQIHVPPGEVQPKKAPMQPKQAKNQNPPVKRKRGKDRKSAHISFTHSFCMKCFSVLEADILRITQRSKN